MVMEPDELASNNAELTESLRQAVLQAKKVADAQDLKIRRLYARNDALEELLRQSGVAVPEWPGPGEGVV